RGIGAVALGHTLDDQAETVLLRLARGSGVDGLSAMAPATRAWGILWLRPLLGVRRAALRDWLSGQGVGWAEDPSNEDPRFDRVRVRAALPALERLGLGPERLAATARNLARARAALEQATAVLARQAVEEGPAGDLALDPAALAGAPEEIRLRLLAAAVGWVSGAVLRPRLVRLEAALAAIETGRIGHGLTLHGCVLRARGGRIAVRREPARTAPAMPIGTGCWDGRWKLVGRPPEGPGLLVGALGAGGLGRLGALPAGIARETLATTPAVWRAGELVAAPLARPEPEFGFLRVYAAVKPWQRD
ncbi:MAG: tRNA lysidine(34) synthetase, partial [Amaricoccus sp.]